MVFRGVFLLLITAISTVGYSQVNEEDSIRATHIQEYPDHFFLWPVLKRRSLHFDVRKAGERRLINYQPNTSYTVGMGAYLFDLAFEITFAIPLNERTKQFFGESTVRDWQLNALSRNWGADLYYQRYNGFYANDPAEPPGINMPLPQRPDIATRNFGVTALYVFNHKKYSLRSAFNFAERQIRKGGSFLITGTINSFKLNADSAVLDLKYRDEFGTGSSFKEIRHTTLSFAPGYAYNFVYRDFFLNGALMIGPAYNWLKYNGEDFLEKNDVNVNLFAAIRFGIGYNGERIFGGINFVQHSRMVKFEDIQFTNSNNTLRLLIGYRFREFGFLRKSVWDLPKELSGKL